MRIEIPMRPFPAPRQSRCEKWNPSKRTSEYRTNRDELLLYLRNYEIKNLTQIELEFIFKMPKRWSGKKIEAYRNFPHTQRPDLDNLIKAVLDTLYRNSDDSQIYKITASKFWGDEDKIILCI